MNVAKTVEAARGYLQLGLPEEAGEMLDLLPIEVRTSSAVVFMRAEIYIHLEKWRKAMALVQPMAGMYPSQPAWWLFWGFSLSQLGEIREALQVLAKAAKFNPENAPIRYSLARCWAAAGEPAKAKAHLERAFEMDQRLRELASDDADLVMFRPAPDQF